MDEPRDLRATRSHTAPTQPLTVTPDPLSGCRTSAALLEQTAKGRGIGAGVAALGALARARPPAREQVAEKAARAPRVGLAQRSRPLLVVGGPHGAQASPEDLVGVRPGRFV